MSPDARRTAGANGVAPPRTSSSAQRPTSAGDACHFRVLATAQVVLMHSALASLVQSSESTQSDEFEKLHAAGMAPPGPSPLTNKPRRRPPPAPPGA